MRLRPKRRPGMYALDAVVCTAVTVVIAAAAYFAVRAALARYFAFIDVVVGSPLM